MCGIHGILSLRNGHRPDPEHLRLMGAASIHRGPDDEGGYAGEGVILGMRRLSIIDLEGGHQPISNEDGTLWVVCNGEIYNFRELRAELSGAGHVFKTGSDTEVILHLYEKYGDDFVRYLDGMFCFALWDSSRKRLLIGRDRLGIKSLYYFQDDSRLIFASEAKSILALPGISVDLDSDAVEQYLALGYVPTPYSMFKGMRKLPPASLMVCENGNVSIRQYWKVPDEIDGFMTETQWAEQLLDKLEQSVVSQMVSDVPLGAFLSGGIDSSCVVGLMARNSDQPIKTYSIGFDTGKAGEYYNELPYARKVSELFKTDHKEIIVRPNVTELLPKLLWHLDEPMADTALITTFLVAQFAREDVTVILSGAGGDELFGGYRRYLGEYYGRFYQGLPRWFRSAVLHPLARRLPSDRHAPFLNLMRYARSFILSAELPFEERYRSYVQVFSQEGRVKLTGKPEADGFDAIGRAFEQAKNGDAIHRLFQVDLQTQLPDDILMLTDKMTMATSLECRVPLLDQELVELAARMPSSMKVHGRQLKYILKKALGTLLPDEILHRQKRGFGAPMGAWLKHELQPLMKQVLSREAVEKRGLFNWQAVEEVVSLHMSNKEDHTDHLLALMNLEIWCRIYMDGMTSEDVTTQLAS